MERHFAQLEEDIASLADKAWIIAEALIKRELKAMQQSLPRHRFSLISGMGTDFVTISPPLLRDRQRGESDRSILSFHDYHPLPPEYRERSPMLAAYIIERMDNISDLIRILDETFHVTIGNVAAD